MGMQAANAKLPALLLHYWTLPALHSIYFGTFMWLGVLFIRILCGQTNEDFRIVEGNVSSIRMGPVFLQRRLEYTLPFPVYYINMDKSKDRRERMERDFGSLWDLRRSPGIDGSNNTLTRELLGPTNFAKAMKYISEERRESDTINKAELGAILSHVVTIRRAHSEGHEIAMIVEDDITPLLMPFWTNSLQDLVEEVNDITKDAWDLIQVGWIWGLDESIYADIITCHGRGRHLKRQHIQWGLGAYIISKKGMEKVISSFFSETEGTIHLQEGRKEAELYVSAASNVYVALPSFFTVEGSDTGILVGQDKASRLQDHQKSNAIHIKATIDLFHEMLKDISSKVTRKTVA